MTDPRIRTIRFWLLSAAVCGACLANPGLAVYFLATYAMAPLGLFMPVFGMAECPLRCTVMPSSISVTFGGIASATCTTCEDYNGTFVFSSLAPSGTLCTQFYATGVHSCDDTDNTGGVVQFSFQPNALQTRISTAVYVGENLFAYSYSAFLSADLGASPIDCSAVGTPALTPAIQADYDCDMSATTASVVVTP
jgi:hypothetical protein